MKNILWMIITISAFLSADFTRDSNGIVSDNSTGLEWQDAYSDNNNTMEQLNWSSALLYCEELGLGGNSDWRLPNLNELYSVVDLASSSPAMDSTFLTIASDYSWSSTSNNLSPEYAWVIYFNNGYISHILKSKSYNVRCVRDSE